MDMLCSTQPCSDIATQGSANHEKFAQQRCTYIGTLELLVVVQELELLSGFWHGSSASLKVTAGHQVLV